MREPREHGQALVAALIIAVVLGVTCASLVVLTLANSASSESSVRRAVALTLAEIGVEKAKPSIANGLFNQQFAAQDHQAVDTGEGSAPELQSYGRWAVRVIENHGGVEDQYLVISQGTSGRTTRQVNVVLRRVFPTIPDPLGAIMLYNPEAMGNFDGVPPRVCGLDTNLPPGIPFGEAKASDCEPGSGDGPDAVGVAAHDDQSVVDIIAALGKKTSRVTGTDGSGGSEPASVYNVTGENPTGRTDAMTAPQVTELAIQCEKVGHYITDGINWQDSDGRPVTDGNFGTTTTPRVVVMRKTGGGALYLEGCVVGVGLLIIDCDVEFAGTFNYAGLVLITNRGNATVSVDMGGTPLVLGTIMAANPAGSTRVLDLRGTADVFFSREGLAYAQKALRNHAKFETVCYVEGQANAADLELE